MKIALDAMGGDFAPNCTLLGAIQALEDPSLKASIVLVGNKDKIIEESKALNISLDGFELVHAEETITMDDHPAKAISQKPHSNINIGYQLLKKGAVQAFCSAGNTGAMMVGGMFSIKTIEGVIRPGIAGFFPKITGNYGILLDAGANADCKADVLDQFATLGSIYYKYLYKKENPKVGLISLGEEKSKGTLLTQAAYQLMHINKKINFVGNIEGSDVFTEKADVMICDGFIGNVTLKMGESFYEILSKRGVKDEFLDLFDYQGVGGSPIIGLNGNVIIGHGRSSPKAIKNMILLCQQAITSEVTQKIKEELI